VFRRFCAIALGYPRQRLTYRQVLLVARSLLSVIPSGGCLFPEDTVLEVIGTTAAVREVRIELGGELVGTFGFTCLTRKYRRAAVSYRAIVCGRMHRGHAGEEVRGLHGRGVRLAHSHAYVPYGVLVVAHAVILQVGPIHSC
jgi:hypothetical protein